MSNLSYSNFFTTGIQDCGNAISPDEFRLELGNVDSIIELFQSEYLNTDGPHRDAWIASQDGEFDGLDPERCYAEWRRGWLSQARRYIAERLETKAA